MRPTTLHLGVSLLPDRRFDREMLMRYALATDYLPLA